MDGTTNPPFNEVANVSAAAKLVGMNRSTLCIYARRGWISTWTLADGSQVVRVADAAGVAQKVRDEPRGRPRRTESAN